MLSHKTYQTYSIYNSKNEIIHFFLNPFLEEKAVPIDPTTSTTTSGPPVGAVVGAVKEMLTNYSNENLPARDLSEAIQAYVDFYFVGINGLDEVCSNKLYPLRRPKKPFSYFEENLTQLT